MTMEPLKEKTLGLFLTRGLSLKSWKEGGILPRELAVYNELARYFGAIRIFTYGNDADLNLTSELVENITVHPLRLNLPKFIQMLLLPFKLAGSIKECDFLKSNQMFGAFGPVLAGRLFKKAVIVRTGYTLTKFVSKETGSPFKKALGHFEEWLSYKSNPLFIVSSKHDFEYVRTRYGLEPHRGLVVANYIDTRLFRPIEMEKVRDVIFVGRFVPQKNLPNLLEALYGTGLKVTMVGRGELESSLREQAEKNGLDIEWLSSVPNPSLPELLTAHRIFVLPSNYEGMPKTLLEAMSCGLAVLGTKVEGITEVIQDGIDGILCNTDASSLRTGILALVSDPGLREKLGRNAQRKIEEEYSLQRLVEREVAFYRERLCAG